MKNTKYTIKELNKIQKDFIINAINSDGYDIDLKTDLEKLQWMITIFKKEAFYLNWEKRYGNIVNLFSEHLQGLPSWLDIPFTNYDILQLLRSWGVVNEKTTEKKEDELLANYWKWVANKVFVLARRAGVNY